MVLLYFCVCHRCVSVCDDVLATRISFHFAWNVLFFSIFSLLWICTHIYSLSPSRSSFWTAASVAAAATADVTIAGAQWCRLCYRCWFWLFAWHSTCQYNAHVIKNIISSILICALFWSVIFPYTPCKILHAHRHGHGHGHRHIRWQCQYIIMHKYYTHIYTHSVYTTHHQRMRMGICMYGGELIKSSKTHQTIHTMYAEWTKERPTDRKEEKLKYKMIFMHILCAIEYALPSTCTIAYIVCFIGICIGIAIAETVISLHKIANLENKHFFSHLLARSFVRPLISFIVIWHAEHAAHSHTPNTCIQ